MMEHTQRPTTLTPTKEGKRRMDWLPHLFLVLAEIDDRFCANYLHLQSGFTSLHTRVFVFASAFIGRSEMQTQTILAGTYTRPPHTYAHGLSQNAERRTHSKQ